MTFHHHNSENSVFIHGILTIKADSRVRVSLFLCFSCSDGVEQKEKALVSGSHHFPLTFEKKKKHQLKKNK